MEEAVKAAIASIKAKEEKINSFVTIDEEGALKKAAAVSYTHLDVYKRQVYLCRR